MHDLEEAKSLYLSYEEIFELSKNVEMSNNIRSLFSLDNFIKKLGGEIKFLPILSWEKFEKPFLSIKGLNNFTIYLFEEISEEMKRVVLVQALVHYMLHANWGEFPCKVDKLSLGIVAREGFIFTLCILMPDEMLVKMIESKKFSNQEIARLFRVPEQILEVKCNVLKKYNKL